MNKPKSDGIGPMRGQLSRLMMSSLDFRHALSAATFLLEEDREAPNFGSEHRRRLKCFETSMVVSYARPFSSARGHAAPFRWALMPKNFELQAQERCLHENLLSARNSLYAHSDEEFSDVAGEIWRTPMPNGNVFDFVAITGGEDVTLSEATVEEIHKFLWKIRYHIDEAIQDHPAPKDHLPLKIRDIRGLSPSED